MAKRVLVVAPHERDRVAVRAAALDERYDVNYTGQDLDSDRAFDAASFLAETAGLDADGVAGTKDRSALLAALVAEARELPGPAPAAIVRCQHKLTSRRLQETVAPEATPRFALLADAGEPRFRPPFFVKPVVGRLSQSARRIDHISELPRETADPYGRAWETLAKLAGVTGLARGLLAEELVSGDEVTLEGYVHRGKAHVIGITDSVKYPGTASFERFEYPTRLDDEHAAELADVAGRLVAAHGFDEGFFNVEFAVPERGPAQILELNARIASQFAPLVQALHGRSTYDALFALACGEDPAWTTEKPDGVAVSYVLRVFEDGYVAEVPDAADDVEILVRTGLRLSEQGLNDPGSYRLAIVYGAGETRAEAVEGCRARAAALRFELT